MRRSQSAAGAPVRSVRDGGRMVLKGSREGVVALRGEQISDFPLCNKSFNLSYCGFDL